MLESFAGITFNSALLSLVCQHGCFLGSSGWADCLLNVNVECEKYEKSLSYFAPASESNNRQAEGR